MHGMGRPHDGSKLMALSRHVFEIALVACNILGQ